MLDGKLVLLMKWKSREHTPYLVSDAITSTNQRNEDLGISLCSIIRLVIGFLEPYLADAALLISLSRMLGRAADKREASMMIQLASQELSHTERSRPIGALRERCVHTVLVFPSR